MSCAQGKLETEALLKSSGIPWTSVRPVYIYGPLNYNPVEEWFFQRIKAGRPVPVPGSGMQVTQLGHVVDLADAFVKVLGNSKAAGQIYNISGERLVTFDGIAKACAKAMGKQRAWMRVIGTHRSERAKGTARACGREMRAGDSGRKQGGLSCSRRHHYAHQRRITSASVFTV